MGASRVLLRCARKCPPVPADGVVLPAHVRHVPGTSPNLAHHATLPLHTHAGTSGQRSVLTLAETVGRSWWRRPCLEMQSWCIANSSQPALTLYNCGALS